MRVCVSPGKRHKCTAVHSTHNRQHVHSKLLHIHGHLANRLQRGHVTKGGWVGIAAQQMEKHM